MNKTTLLGGWACWVGAAALAAPEIVGISIPPGSQDGGCYPVWDALYSASAPIDTSLGIGYLLNPNSPSAAAFSLHDHVYLAPNVPDPTRAIVTFQFDDPAVVDQIEITQHANGITAIEGFVGSSPGSLASIGSVFGPDGDVTGDAYFAEGRSYIFDFDNLLAGTLFAFVVTKTSEASGWASYRAFPRDDEGVRFDVRDTAFTPTNPAVPEGGTSLAAGVALLVAGGAWYRRRSRLATPLPPPATPTPEPPLR